MNAEKIILPFIKVVKKVKKRMQKRFPDLKLNATQMETLHYIKHRKRVLMKDLADFLSVTPPSVTTLTNRLVEFGIIKRETERSDRRNTILSFTAKGNALFESKKKESIDILQKMIDRLSEEEQLQLFNILEKMAKEDK